MKRFIAFAALVVLTAALVIACAPLTPQQADTLHQSAQAQHDLATRLRAAATQPGVTPAQARDYLARADDLDRGADATHDFADKGTTRPSLGAAVEAARPFIPPPYQFYVDAGLALATLAGGIFGLNERKKRKKHQKESAKTP